mgnify:CR=1 FL=1|tara:strand:+ start:40 stop:513 length:474 start_codon:yes stop_codon:yes gene_type:complete
MISRESKNSFLICFKKAFYKIVLLVIFAFSGMGISESLFVIHTYDKEFGSIIFVDKDSIKLRDDRLVSFWLLEHFEPKIDGEIGSVKEYILADCKNLKSKTIEKIAFHNGMGQKEFFAIKSEENSIEWKDDKNGFLIGYPCRRIYRKYKDEYNLDWK